MNTAKHPVISVHGLFRRFGRVQAVNGLSFSVEEGEVVGFIGANGAGKTSTMRILATLDMPDQGTVKVAGRDVLSDPLGVRRRIGWVPDAFQAYPNLTVREYVDFFARAHGFRGAERRSRVGDVLEFTGMDALAGRMADKLSKGQTQRLCLCRALLHDPKVLILDEPAAGLDPQARAELKQLIRILAEEGRSMLISSHILSELAEMCDRMVFIHEGRLLHDGRGDELRRHGKDRILVEIQLAEPCPGAAAVIELLPGVLSVQAAGATLRVAMDDPAAVARARLLRALVQADLPVTEYRAIERNLEEAFIELLGNARAAAEPPPLPPAAS